MSKPQVGDQVSYKPDPVSHPTVTYPAFVAKVNEETVNLSALDENGSFFRAINVPFLETGSVPEPYAFPKAAKSTNEAGGPIVQHTENPDHGDDSDIVSGQAPTLVGGLISGGIAPVSAGEVSA